MLFEFTDFAAKQRRWWLVIHKGEIDLCRSDPGFELDFHALGDLRTFTQVWMGDVSLHRAPSDKAIQLNGDAKLKKSVVASVKTGR